MDKPTHKFHQDDPEWQKFCFEQARTLDLNTRDLAALCKVPLNTFVNMRAITSVIAEGRALFKSRVQQEFLGYLLADPTMYEDPQERAHIRTLQMDALKQWMKLETKREELAHLTEDKEKDRSVLKDLTSEELRTKARELLK